MLACVTEYPFYQKLHCICDKIHYKFSSVSFKKFQFSQCYWPARNCCNNISPYSDYNQMCKCYSIGGLILDFTVSIFKGIAVYQPVINGVGGNLVAVQASRISTSLHQDSRLGKLPHYASSVCLNPLSVFCSQGKTESPTLDLLCLQLDFCLFAFVIIFYLDCLQDNSLFYLCSFSPAFNCTFSITI
jgi:hypothetical protein